MRIYTRTGDEGKTSVIGARVAKDDARVEAYGTIDELNAAVGQAAAIIGRDNDGHWNDMLAQLTVIQHELFDCGSDLSYASPVHEKMKVTDEMAAQLEQWIDRYSDQTPPLARFILPGGSEQAAALHVCRTVCRRAERRVVALAAVQPCPQPVVKYVNRLSDYFFAAARAANALLGTQDVEYERGAIVFRRRS
ncbi:cob(I)yrinic acid a,c-diamide adenosyltransferase [Cohnella panacarvi]|uniref:cob(I)yrinic acid a,c-diamide adenosyltransferase n=1 Tax=Cohnella panacarvi TaxID=400776 RepID=UPI00047D159B|nr:cob(I)yrinic acid a,c-diamide adenosyltransferase [Cohnella panacarvi]